MSTFEAFVPDLSSGLSPGPCWSFVPDIVLQNRLEAGSVPFQLFFAAGGHIFVSCMGMANVFVWNRSAHMCQIKKWF